MYGYGDSPNPQQESVDVMEEILEWYILDLCEKALKTQTGSKLKTSDFLHALAKDPKKLARAHELLTLDKELKSARAAFDMQEVVGLAKMKTKED